MADNAPDNLITCIGCGARLPDVDSGGHRYLGASPGCWAVYSEVLAREYSDVRYGSVHQLTVDAYAAQHPGKPGSQTMQSVALHLISLYLQLEMGASPMQVIRVRQTGAKEKGRFSWLTPPEDPGRLTIVHVHQARDANEHIERVTAWAHSVWTAWTIHHATVRVWAAALDPDL